MCHTLQGTGGVYTNNSNRRWKGVSVTRHRAPIGDSEKDVMLGCRGLLRGNMSSSFEGHQTLEEQRGFAGC